jgi:hypothetical protein
LLGPLGKALQRRLEIAFRVDQEVRRDDHRLAIGDALPNLQTRLTEGRSPSLDGRSGKDLSGPGLSTAQAAYARCTQTVDDPTFGNAAAVAIVEHPFEFCPERG